MLIRYIIKLALHTAGVYTDEDEDPPGVISSMQRDMEALLTDSAIDADTDTADAVHTATSSSGSYSGTPAASTASYSAAYSISPVTTVSTAAAPAAVTSGKSAIVQ
jgi:hypothetical protein